jgi:hypothetical protein
VGLVVWTLFGGIVEVVVAKLGAEIHLEVTVVRVLVARQDCWVSAEIDNSGSRHPQPFARS